MTDRFDNKQLHNLQPWRAGEVIRERKLNQSVDALNELRRGIRPPRQIVGPVIPQVEAVGVEQRLVFLWAVGFDRLICRRDPNDADTAVYVAKPHQLRRTPWVTFGRPWFGSSIYTYRYDNPYTRRATERVSGVAETQTIRPSYATGDPILIQKVSAAVMWKSGESDGVPWSSTELQNVEWMDMQWPTAREWASVPSE